MSPAPAAACGLCGQPCGPAESYCCPGCRNVHAILRESGALADGADPKETELFRRSLELGLISQCRTRTAGPKIPENTESVEAAFELGGLWCPACGWLIEHTLSRERGVVSAEVHFASDLLKVRYAPQYLPPDRIRECVEQLGYRAADYRPGEHGARDQARRDLLLRTGVAAFLWLNVMTLSGILYVGYFENVAGDIRRNIPFLLMALSAGAIFYSGWPVFRVAAIGLGHGALRVEALLGAGILAAWGFSAVEAFRGGAHFYFDTACALVTLVLGGKLLETGARDRTDRAIALLYRMMPSKARLVEHGRELFVAVSSLEPGQVFLVKAGERIPADGDVEEGGASVDQSVLTGESAPVRKQAGDRVAAGSFNVDGVLRVRSTQSGEGGTLGDIVRSVESALTTRSGIVRAVDRVSRVFIPAVIAIAAATFAGWYGFGGAPAASALSHAIAVLVIACPCALGIATPMALAAAIGAASRHGILVNHASVLETLPRVDTVVFDKTGTITEGVFAVQALEGDLGPLASLEAASEHPIGQALVRHARKTGAVIEPVTNVVRHEGMGLEGTVGRRCVFAGSTRLLQALNLATETQLPAAAQWVESGCTLIYFGWDGQVRGWAALGDRIREDAAGAVAELGALGIRTVLLSGDTPEATGKVARAVGAQHFRAGVLPAGKAEAIAEMQRAGAVVAMAGDGVNDAPALARADLGIAMGSGTALAMQAAPVVLMSNSLHRVLDTIRLARRTVRVVRMNLFWAFLYNTAGIVLAAAGYLHPIAAAGAMVVSSLSVVTQSSRLAGWNPEARPKAANGASTASR
ncbi:MAG: cation-translocating P-type ATPase [Bryobacteraceae bacterium]